MTERVILHVGGPKSGTTYLQGVLRGHAEELSARGVLVCGRAQVDLVHAAMVLRDDRRLTSLPPRAKEAWARLVDEIRAWPGPVAVVSYELFSNLSAEQVRAGLADLDGLEVHVVVTARDLGRALTSAWQERLKFGLAEPLDDWTPPDDSVVGSEWGWRTLDPASVATRWGTDLDPSRVHLVTVPRGGDPEELWRRFAEACQITGIVDAAAAGRANESLDVAAAEVLRRANPHLRDFLRTPRERALWSRDLLANRVLAGLGREPLAPSPEQHRQASQRYAAVCRTVGERSWTVHGDLADLQPRPVEGRTTSEVGDREVADVAVRALAVLLREVRNDASEPPPAAATPAATPAAGSGGTEETGRLGSLLAGATGRRVAGRVQELHDRIDALEQALDDRRRLQQRLAMLTDLVAELMVPLEEADEAEQDRLIREYRRVST